MKAKMLWLFLMISVLCLFTWSGYAQRLKPQSPGPAWEYKVITQADEGKLNELGAQGWELVSASPAIPTERSTGTTVYYFKSIR